MMDDGIKNIFDFATKELSQDAFLRWLIENYNSNNKIVRMTSYSFISTFLGFNNILKDGEIQSVKTWTQWAKIDLLAEIVLKDGSHYVLAIEDKTGSNIHDNQLERYSKAINNYYFKNKKISKLNWKISNIFYKTSLPDDIEIRKCNEVSVHPWTPVYIKEIVSFFSEKKFLNSGSEILDSYIKHVNNLLEKYTKVAITTPINDWDKINFKTYLKSLKDKYDNKNSKIKYDCWDYLNMYSAFTAKHEYGNVELILEIDTRVNVNGSAHIKISVQNKDNHKAPVDNNVKKALCNYISQNIYKDENNIDLFKLSHSGKTIAVRNNLLKRKLSYDNTFNDFDKLINDIIKWFSVLASVEYKTIEAKYR